MSLSGFNTPSRTASPPHQRLQYDFSGQSFTRTVRAILFDMDGTIIDSTNAIVKHWNRVGETYGLDPSAILATSHGRRSIDVFQAIDPARANWEYVREIERLIPQEFGHDAVEIKGARSLLMALEETGAKWTIVTSGTLPLVQGWLKILGLVEPPFIVTAEDVVQGKPDPTCYNLGRCKLDLPSSAPVLVFEDAPAGIRAGKAAGCLVVALATTHAVAHLIDAGADWIVQDLRSVRLESIDPKTGEMRIRISGLCKLK